MLVVSDFKGLVARLLMATCLFFGLLQTFTIGLSLLQIRIGQFLSLLLILSAAVLSLLYFRLQKSRENSTQSSPSPSNLAWPIVAFGAVVGIWMLMVFVFASAKPDFTADGNLYHIPTIHCWIETGYVHWIDMAQRGLEGLFSEENCNGLPKAAELIGFLLVQATNASALVNTYNILFLPLGIFAVAHLAAQLGASANASVLAASLYPLVPLGITQAFTTYVDSATASTYIALIAVLATCCVEMAKGKTPWRYLPALGAACGLAMGVKGTGPALYLLSAGLLLVSALLPPLARMVFPRNGSPRETVTRQLMRSLVVIATFTVLTIAVGGYWSIRNYVHTGNPIYPVELSLFGRQIFEGRSIEEQVARRITLPEGAEDLSYSQLLRHTWLQGAGAGQWPESIRSHASREGGLGFLWPVACLPAIVLIAGIMGWKLLRGRRDRNRKSRDPFTFFGVAALVYLLLFLITPYNYWPRFTIWLYGLGLPCFALVISLAFAGRSRVVKASATAWVVACIAIALYEAGYSTAWAATRTRAGENDWPRFDVDIPRASRAFLWHDEIGYLHPELTGSLFEEALKQSGPIALGYVRPALWRIRGQLLKPLGKRSLLFMPSPTLQNPKALASFLSEHEIAFVVCDAQTNIPPALYELAAGWEAIGPEKFVVFDLRD